VRMSFGFRLSELRARGITPRTARRSDPATTGIVNSFWRQERFRLGILEERLEISHYPATRDGIGKKARYLTTSTTE
jgi:hypothetical protein